MRTTRTLAALTLALVLAITGCAAAKTEQGVKGSGPQHDDADVAFATGMIPHHDQALSMADMTEGRPLDAEVAALVEDIRRAQAPEIKTMTGWLNEWDEEVPAGTQEHGHADDADSADRASGTHYMGDMPGMMSTEDMSALEEASDAKFQRMWLTMMIEHHQGAIKMAEKERAAGQFEPAVALAEDIISAQKKEIGMMKSQLS